MSNQTKQKRPNYTLEFKKDAAKLVIEKGYTHNQAAELFGDNYPVRSATTILTG